MTVLTGKDYSFRQNGVAIRLFTALVRRTKLQTNFSFGIGKGGGREVKSSIM